jgi:site-specific DNA recombinase
MWPPLVSAERFWAVQRLLADPGRRGKRPASASHLLSYQVRCAVCDAPLSAGRSKPVRDSYEPAVTYSCSEGRHASIMASVLDAYVLRRLLDWLADPEILADLTRVDDAEAAALARADADRAQAELAELHQLARAGRVSSAGFSAQEEGLLRRIEEADRRMRASAVPSVVAGVLGPDAGDRFGRLDLAQQREVVRQVAEIRVRPVGRGRRVHPASGSPGAG